MSQAQSIKTAISIKDYGLNSILYQRNIYPSESFKMTDKYELKLLVTTDDSLKQYFQEILSQIKNWLNQFTIRKFVIAIKNTQTSQVVERWQFNIECDKSKKEDDTVQVNLDGIQSDIRAIIRQITASVSFLPTFDFPCSFEILAYTDKDTKVPDCWHETDDHKIIDEQNVPLRSFSTSIHKVNAGKKGMSNLNDTDIKDEYQNLLPPLKPMRSEFSRNGSSMGARFGHLSLNSFFVRHSPHPQRVRHIKGLLGIPICSVNDAGFFSSPKYNKNILPQVVPANAINTNNAKLPVNTILGTQFVIGDEQNVRKDVVDRLGLFVDNMSWKSKLKEFIREANVSDAITKAKNKSIESVVPLRYSKTTGRLIPTNVKSYTSRKSKFSKKCRTTKTNINTVRKITAESYMDAEIENLVIEMLCQILQTNDVSQVHAWLLQENEREKEIVKSVIRMAIEKHKTDNYNPKPSQEANIEFGDISNNDIHTSTCNVIKEECHVNKKDLAEVRVFKDTSDKNKKFDRLTMLDQDALLKNNSVLEDKAVCEKDFGFSNAKINSEIFKDENVERVAITATHSVG